MLFRKKEELANKVLSINLGKLALNAFDAERLKALIKTLADQIKSVE